jgi:tetratricopeptide (TPR) repeat protein
MNLGRILLSAALAVLSCYSPSSAPGQESSASAESCLSFVQDFYGWYARNASNTNVDSLDLALKERRSAFSTKLINGVEAVNADARPYKEAGLDFDWILNSQDPGGPGDYIVSIGRLAGYACRVDVFRQRADGNGEKISPELKFENGRWLFVNFHYPDSPYPQSENLLSMIAVYLNDIPEKKLKENLNDFDALTQVGIRLEEEDKLDEALSLYKKAIKGWPTRYEGYYFAGLLEEHMVQRVNSNAETDIRQALSLKPDLSKDPNVSAFLKRHAPIRSQAPQAQPTFSLGNSSRFFVGIGIGMILATMIIFAFRRKTVARIDGR